MTQTEMMALKKGRIPSGVVLNEIKSFLRRYEGEEIERGLVEGIAAKAEISPETIFTWLGQERIDSIRFDTADKIMLYVVGPMWGSTPEYEAYYQGVNLNVQECACPGCETMIEIVSARGSGGGVQRKYCSQICRQVAYQIRTGQKNRRSKRHMTGMLTCRRGHKRTPENTKLRKDGRSECMVCAREASRRHHANKKKETA